MKVMQLICTAYWASILCLCPRPVNMKYEVVLAQYSCIIPALAKSTCSDDSFFLCLISLQPLRKTGPGAFGLMAGLECESFTSIFGGRPIQQVTISHLLR